MYFSHRKIKPQGRPRVNLCALNKNICLGLSVWLHYAKIVCSLEDRANPPSHLPHKPRLRTGADPGRLGEGRAPSPTEELIITSQLFSYTSGLICSTVQGCPVAEGENEPQQAQQRGTTWTLQDGGRVRAARSSQRIHEMPKSRRHKPTAAKERSRRNTSNKYAQLP